MDFRGLSNLIMIEQTLFALPFALIGVLFAGGGKPLTWILVIIALAAARTAGMSFNRVIDAEIDAKNPRTEDRALPQGELSPSAVWLAAAAACLIFVLAAALLNPLCFYLSFIAVFLLVLFLGIAFRHMLHSLWLGGVDRLGGALLGMIKGVLLCGVITLLLMTGFSQDAGMLRSSRIAPYMVRISGEMSSYIPDHLKKKFRQTAKELQTAWEEKGIPHWFDSDNKGES